MLISNDASYCGLAYVMNDPRTFNYPFSVIAPNCLPLTLAHELGHNFGMQHDHDQYTAGGGPVNLPRRREAPVEFAVKSSQVRLP